MKVVISASVGFERQIKQWISIWENAGHKVIAYPDKIDKAAFAQDYPEVYREFYAGLNQADLLFVLNEDRKNIKGYIGASVFAELAYVAANNILGQSKTKIILLRMPGDDVQSSSEIKLWIQLGWVELFHKQKLASGLPN